MNVWNRVVSPAWGRRIVLAVGGLYVAIAVGRAGARLADGAPLANEVIVATLIGGPGFVLLYGGYRLPHSDVLPSFYPIVAGWCLGAIAAMLGLLAFYDLQPGAGISDPAQSVPALTALASVAGFGVGIHDARARTRARAVERQNRELRRTQARLEETVEQLRASNERLEQFAYAASHDLQEPLRMVSSYLQLTERRYGDELDPDGREFIEYAVDGADRMRTMVDGLLQYSRVDTGGQPFEPVELDAIMEDVREDLQVRIDETDAEIVVDPLPRVRGDRDQLRQVFQNLLSNAIEYSGDGPPRIHVTAERRDARRPDRPGEAFASRETAAGPGTTGRSGSDAGQESDTAVRSDGSQWVVSVRDEGIGIDPEDQGRIFEVFQRLHDRDGHPGTGIGLALCERIVERHGGDIRVDSVPGEGSTFSVTLPAAE